MSLCQLYLTLSGWRDRTGESDDRTSSVPGMDRFQVFVGIIFLYSVRLRFAVWGCLSISQGEGFANGLIASSAIFKDLQSEQTARSNLVNLQIDIFIG